MECVDHGSHRMHGYPVNGQRPVLAEEVHHIVLPICRRADSGPGVCGFCGETYTSSACPLLVDSAPKECLLPGGGLAAKKGPVHRTRPFPQSWGDRLFYSAFFWPSSATASAPSSAGASNSPVLTA
jgi:hypothetical protein